MVGLRRVQDMYLNKTPKNIGPNFKSSTLLLYNLICVCFSTMLAWADNRLQVGFVYDLSRITQLTQALFQFPLPPSIPFSVVCCASHLSRPFCLCVCLGSCGASPKIQYPPSSFTFFVLYHHQLNFKLMRTLFQTLL